MTIPNHTRLYWLVGLTVVGLATIGVCGYGLTVVVGMTLFSAAAPPDGLTPRTGETLDVPIGGGNRPGYRMWIEPDLVSLRLPERPSNVSVLRNVNARVHPVIGTWSIQLPVGQPSFQLTVGLNPRYLTGEPSGLLRREPNPWDDLLHLVESRRSLGELAGFEKTRIAGHPAIELAGRPGITRNPGRRTHEMIVLVGAFRVSLGTTVTGVEVPTPETREVLNSIYFNPAALRRMKAVSRELRAAVQSNSGYDGLDEEWRIELMRLLPGGG